MPPRVVKDEPYHPLAVLIGLLIVTAGLWFLIYEVGIWLIHRL